jgi:lipocalin
MNKSKKRYVSGITAILIFFAVFSCLGCQSKTPEDMDFSTVEELDLERYMGKWYEIARFDHRFERNLVGVTATYSLRNDGKIKIVNAGYKNSFNGKYKKSKGKAKQPNSEEPGKLKVSFFLFFYADYFILELGEEYRWALIGSSSDKYLWILSRTPQLDQDTLDHILGKAKERGYDTSHFIWVPQPEE